MPRARRRSPSSPASRAAPSIASALVSSTRSPVRAERLSFSSARRSVPSAVSDTTGRVTASVTSVWPPARVTPASSAAAASPPRTARACDGVVPTGRSTVASSQRGSAPEAAMSLTLTRTAARPTASPPRVIGSPWATRSSAPSRSTAATSSPIRGGTSRAGSPPATPARNPASRSFGSLPGASGRPSRTTSSSSARRPTMKSQSAVSGPPASSAPAPPPPAPAAVGEVRGDGAGGAPRLHVQQIVADHERLLRSGAHHGGGVQHAVRRRLGRHVVVAGHDDVEVGGGEGREAAQGALDGGQPVAREDADGEAVLLEPADELLGAFVRRRGVGGGKFEALEGEGCGRRVLRRAAAPGSTRGRTGPAGSRLRA